MTFSTLRDKFSTPREKFSIPPDEVARKRQLDQKLVAVPVDAEHNTNSVRSKADPGQLPCKPV